MTKVKVYKKESSFIGLECDGHTKFKIQGEDILCAAISGITQAALLGILKICGVELSFKRDDKKGYLKFMLPAHITGEQQFKANIILETCVLGISDLAAEYSDFIEITHIENYY